VVQETGTPENTRENTRETTRTGSPNQFSNRQRLNVRAYPSPLRHTIKPPPKTAKNKFKIIGIFVDIPIALRKRYMLLFLS